MRSLAPEHRPIAIALSAIPTPHSTRGCARILPRRNSRCWRPCPGLCDLDRGLERHIRAKGLDGGVDSRAPSQVKDPLNNILAGEVDDLARTVCVREFLPIGNGFDSDDQADAPEPGSYGRHQSHRALGEDSHGSANRDVPLLRPHEAGREHVCAVDRHSSLMASGIFARLASASFTWK